ncbi:MAG TPA: ABC transporter substrate-binding protein [Candidatus Sulfomarinibacteraceae bacterium]|nr:ABC transporter substrate-binding protein [Candidatus Sulfomarinibacteraceae bacterium]
MKRLLLILLVIAMALAACQQAPPEAEDDDTAPAAQEEQAEPGTESEEDDAEPEVAEPAPGMRVLRATFSWPTFIDPAVGNDFSSSASLVNLYDTLVFPNVDGGVDPWVAESWETSDDGLTWTFTLRDDVTFHDGTPLEASDVVYSLERLQNIGEGFAYLFDNVQSASAVDEHTVEFTLNNPSGLFLSSLVRLYILNEDLVRENTAAEGAYGEEGDYGKDWLLTNDAGSGPYQVVDFPLEEYLLMDKFEDWWGEFRDDAPDQLRFIATTETATVRTLMNDQQLEISDQWQTVEALQALDQIEGINIAAIPTMNEFYFMINTTIPPTDDIHCRRAMAYAFDYDTAISLEWEGTQQSVGPAPISTGGHNPDVFNFSRDLDRAMEELDQCQYADSLDQYPVEFHWVSEVPDEEKFALLFQSNMAEIGMPVEVTSVPWLSTVENMSSQDTSPHIVSVYVTADLPEAGVMLQQRYHPDTADQWLQNEWLLDEEFDAMVEEAVSTIDREERFQKYHELQDYIAELAPSIFVYDQVEKHAYQDYVDWPAVNGEMSAVQGHYFFAPMIGVNPPSQ